MRQKGGKVSKNKLYLPPERFYISPGENVYREQEKRAEIARVVDFQELERRRRRQKVSFDPKLKKIGEILGLELWLVDGERIRNEVYVDFTSGGHAYRYFYVPLNEIWIDDGLRGGDLKPTIWHELTERRFMVRGWSYNEAHGKASGVEIDIRKERQFVLPVANFRQTTNYSCGPVALQTVLEYLGKPLTEKAAIKLSKTDPAVGANPKDLAEAAKTLGFDVIWKEKWTIDEVRKLLEKGLPMIVNFQQNPGFGEGHYAVIVGYTGKNEFIISDPSSDEPVFRKEKIASFIKRWHELEDKTEQEGIVIYK